MFERLKSLLTIPDNAINTGDTMQWIETEKKLGIKLPNDYKEFIDTYGTGIIANFLIVFSPFSTNENMNLFSQLNMYRDSYLILKESYPKDFTYEIFPNERGLLPWGMSENGDVLSWTVSQNSQDWKIIIDGRSGDFFEYNGLITKFLYSILTKNLVSPVFPEDFPDNELKSTFKVLS